MVAAISRWVDGILNLGTDGLNPLTEQCMPVTTRSMKARLDDPMSEDPRAVPEEPMPDAAPEMSASTPEDPMIVDEPLFL